MKTGLILIGAALVIFIVLSFISRFTNHKKDLFEFELDDLGDLHWDQEFWNDSLQFAYRLANCVCIALFAAGVIVLSLNCFPEHGMSWEIVLLRLLAAFFAFIVAGWILVRVSNAIACGIPVLAIVLYITPLMLWEHLRGRD